MTYVPPGHNWDVAVVDETDPTRKLKVNADGSINVDGTYNSTPPTLANGASSVLQLDSSGRLLTSQAPMDRTTDSIATYGTTSEQPNLTAGALNADLVPSTDVSAFRSFSLQVTGTWVGTLTLQGSNDNVTFNTVQAFRWAQGTNTGTITSNEIYVGAVTFRYFRVRMTAYTSGTATGTLELSTLPSLPILSFISAAQSGSWNTNVNATPTVTTVAVATTDTSVLGSNANRKGLIFSNVGANNIWLNLAGGTAVNTNFLLAPGASLVLLKLVPTTAIRAIAVTGTTNLSVTELA